MTTKRLRLILSATALAVLAAVIVLCFSATSRSARIARLITDPASVPGLALLTDERDIRCLAEYLCDANPAVRARAVDALAAIGPAAVKPTFDVARKVLVNPTVNRAPGLRRTALYRWITSLRSTPDRAAAMLESIDALAPRFGTAAVAPLVEMLAGGEPFQQRAALYGLARIHDERAFQALIASLSDTRGLIMPLRVVAVRALALSNDPRAVQVMLDMYDGKNAAPSPRSNLVAALARHCTDPRVVDRLLPLADDPTQNPSFREQAITGLADSTDSRIPDVLRPLTNDPDSGVRAGALYALKRLGIDSVSASAAPLRLDLRKGPFAVRLAQYAGLRVTVSGVWNPAGKEGGYVSGGGAQPAEPIYIEGSTPAALAKLNALYQLRPGAPLQITGTLRSYVPPADQLDPTIQRPVAHLYFNAADITVDSPTLESSAP